MKKRRFLFACGLIVLIWGVTLCLEKLTAQEAEPSPRGQRGRSSGPPSGGDMGGPPWMRGGSGGNPPWMEGRQGRDRNRQGRERGGQNDAERNERYLGMLRAMDRNGNGKLEQDEIPEYRRNFVSMVVTRMGGDPSKTIDLNALAARASGGGSSAPTRSRGGSGSAASSATATDPLVPYFGEKEEAKPSIPAFGQREPAPKTAVGGASSAAPALSASDQVLRSARDIMNKYDKTKSGTLDKDKGEWVGSLPFNPQNADKNRDGRITMGELIEILGGKAGSSTGAAAVATRQSSAYDRLPPGVPSWFFERDKDQDGQITMQEYAGGKSWTEAMADEFRFLDKNNDGVATVAEVFAVLKQVDEEKRLKEEQAKREQERRRGVGASTARSEAKKPETPGAPAQGTSPGAAPTEVPSGAPYASGSSDAGRRRESGRSGGSRRSSSRR